MTTRLALDTKAISLMALLCAIWGMQQVVLKATAADIAPIMQIALRSGVAATLVALVMAWRGERMNLRHTTASHMVVFLYTAPLFGIAFGAWLLRDPIEASFLLGAVPVLIGIVLVSGGVVSVKSESIS